MLFAADSLQKRTAAAPQNVEMAAPTLSIAAIAYCRILLLSLLKLLCRYLR